ncbi:MAG: class I SAM-dependent RNA methyltransferase [Candidatus Nanopelagicales bacterium]
MPSPLSADQSTRPPAIGESVELTVESAVAGGLCLGRSDGRVVFVRGALPGETVRARVVGHGKAGAFLRTEVAEVLTASPARVTPPCPIAGECGGCDWQHATLPEQRAIKAAVIVDAMRRIGGIDRIGDVELADVVAVRAPDSGSGLNWRTRMRFATDGDGVLGLRAANSRRVIAASNCPISSTGIRSAVAGVAEWPTDSEVVAAESSSGEVYVHGVTGPRIFHEAVKHRNWEIPTTIFWQVHPAAAMLLVDAVVELAVPKAGETVLDLFSGAGLFAAFLGEAVGETGRVDAIEGSVAAVTAARANLTDVPQVRHHRSDVAAWLRHSKRRPVDLVVLDPPRAGAGREVVRSIVRRQPHRVVYVACDPVALARDAKTFAGLGYSLDTLVCFDIFPMTKHVECVALFERTDKQPHA